MELIFWESGKKNQGSCNLSEDIKLVRGGKIYNTNGLFDWSRTHVQVPKPILIHDDTVRIFYGTRDLKNRTRTSFIDVEAGSPQNVKYIHNKPVIDLGQDGSFDADGVMPGSIVRINENKLYLYYTGWKKTIDNPYKVEIGIAVSYDEGYNFERVTNAPVIGSPVEKISCSQPFVLYEENAWQMLYSSFVDWQIIDGNQEPIYCLKYAHSTNGLDWTPSNNIWMGLEENSFSISNPSIWKEGNVYKVLYSYRKVSDYKNNSQNSYKIGYAESQNCVDWISAKNNPVLNATQQQGESVMTAYPGVYKFHNKVYVIYCGDGFGKSGIYYATLSEV